MTDKGNAPEHTGQLTGGTDALVLALQGFYLKVFPTKDQWGNFYVINTRDAITSEFGIALAEDEVPGDDDFVVASYGRDGEEGPTYAYEVTDPSAGLYEVGAMKDFNEDIVNWNGNMVVGPRTAGGTT